MPVTELPPQCQFLSYYGESPYQLVFDQETSAVEAEAEKAFKGRVDLKCLKRFWNTEEDVNRRHKLCRVLLKENRK